MGVVNFAGYIEYNHSNNGLKLYTNGGQAALTLDSSQNATFAGEIITTDDININADNKKLNIGASADFKIHHDGSTNIIDGQYHPIELRHQSEVHIKCVDDGAVELYHDNSKKFETNSAGVKVTGGLEATGFLAVADNQNIYAGSDNDFYIRHNGTNAMLGNGTGDLYIWNTAGNDSSVIRIQAKYDEDRYSLYCQWIS